MKSKAMSIFVVITVTTIATITMAMSHLPEPEADAFWTYISETNPYTNWEMWPGKDGFYPGTSPHGAFLKLFVNDVALKALKEDAPMPDGAIIVKENYDKDKQFMAITPMYLKKGYNPEAGDWFWTKYGPEGALMAAGKVEGCINCHKTQPDWLFTEK
jgi:hypothetical protein